MNQLTNKSAHKKNKETDNIISHFILIGIFLINTLTDILSLIISAIQENSKPSVIDAKELEIKNNLLTTKTNDELIEILNGTNTLSKLDKEQLVNLIYSNRDALKKAIRQERRKVLSQKTVIDLKGMIKTEQKTSSFKRCG